jgi:protein involved in polysaccharide export with SLBB domain
VPLLVLLSLLLFACIAGAQLPSTPTTGSNQGPTTPSGDVSGTGTGTGAGTTSQGSVPGLGTEIESGLSRMSDTGSLAGAIDPSTYLVGPGDVLQLLLWGKVSRSLLLEVGPQGTVLLPGAGPIQVDGLTLLEVRTEVLKRLKQEFRGVNAELSLSRPRRFRVYLTGQVKTPGPIPAVGANTVGDVVTSSMLLDNASQRRIELLRRDGTRELADLDLFLRTGDRSLNPMLRDGDVINIPVATDFIYAEGAVARPDRYELGPRDSLLTLFRLAGDPVPAADANRCLLIRWRSAFLPESLWFTLGEVYARRLNPALREGDRLYVYFVPTYHLQHEAEIFGEVSRPGVYPIAEGKHRLSDLVASAGGFLSTADLSSIRVHRRNPATGEKDPELDRLLRLSRAELTNSEYDALQTKLASLREDYRIDWSRLQTHSSEIDLLLRDGDIVRVERLVSSIRVDGEVLRPGIVTFQPGRKVGDYVKSCGGFTDRAWTSRIRVTRAGSGQTLLARNVKALDPGDFVWVPEIPDKTMWDSARELLTSLALIATIVIAIQGVNR